MSKLSVALLALCLCGCYRPLDCACHRTAPQPPTDDSRLKAIEQKLSMIEGDVKNLDERERNLTSSMQSMLKIQEGNDKLFDEIHKREAITGKMLEANNELLRGLMELDRKYGRR